MKKKHRIQDEFYIGYLPQAPHGHARFIRTAIVITGVLSLILCVLLALNQRKFSDSIFEYGTLTAVEGILSLQPVPTIGVVDDQGYITHSLLLVGFGKFGALPTIRQLETITGKVLAGQQVILKGTRIYGHGKGLLQITVEDNISLTVKSPAHNTPPGALKPGVYQKLYGEVVDPKCYFGVMKPGEGKPHRSCAVRCIAGGIPPVFAVHRDGVVDYVVLTGNGLNETILPFVGEPLQLEGELTAYYDWTIMKVDTKKIQTLAVRKKAFSWPVQEDGITLCTSP